MLGITAAVSHDEAIQEGSISTRVQIPFTFSLVTKVFGHGLQPKPR